MAVFQRISAPTMKELFVQQITDLIFSGQLKVGSRLPPERSLAEQMGIGKAVVHSGLEELARIGLVYTKPQSGVYVADYMKTGNLDTFNAIVRYSGENMSYELLREFCDIRLATEGFSVIRACRLRTDDEIEHLRCLIDEVGICGSREIVSYQELGEHLYNFHFEIYRMSHSIGMPFIMNALRPVALIVWTTYLKVTPFQEVIDNLDQIVRFIETSDPDGACTFLKTGVECFLDKMKP